VAIGYGGEDVGAAASSTQANPDEIELREDGDGEESDSDAADVGVEEKDQ
jgi:hypothetical protein